MSKQIPNTEKAVVVMQPEGEQPYSQGDGTKKPQEMISTPLRKNPSSQKDGKSTARTEEQILKELGYE
jgi:hypothetical protein